MAMTPAERKAKQRANLPARTCTDCCTRKAAKDAIRCTICRKRKTEDQRKRRSVYREYSLDQLEHMADHGIADYGDGDPDAP